MNTTNQLPPLPKPDIAQHTQEVWIDDVRCTRQLGPRYTADQMCAYALQAIAQATQAVEPMTREQISKCIGEVMLNSGYGSHHFGWAIELARAIEAHHGITAQAKKETP